MARQNQAQPTRERPARAAEPFRWEDHREAMVVRAAEDALRAHCGIYDAILELDLATENLEVLLAAKGRSMDAESEVAQRPSPHERLREWVAESAAVEEFLLHYESRGYRVDGADEFRKRFEQATWALLPDDEKFDVGEVEKLLDETRG